MSTQFAVPVEIESSDQALGQRPHPRLSALTAGSKSSSKSVAIYPHGNGTGAYVRPISRMVASGLAV